MVSFEKINAIVSPAVFLSSVALSFHPDTNVSRVANLVCAGWVTNQIVKARENAMPKVRAFIALAAAGISVSPKLIAGAYAFSMLKERIIGQKQEPVVEESPVEEKKPVKASRTEDFLVGLFASSPADQLRARELYKENLARIEARDAAKKANPFNLPVDVEREVPILEEPVESLVESLIESPVVRKPRKSADREICAQFEESQELVTRSLRSREILSPSPVRKKRTSDVVLTEFGIHQGLHQQEGRVLRNRVVRI